MSRVFPVLFVATVFLCFCSSCFAQSVDWLELWESPLWRLKEQAEAQTMYRSNWEGKGSWMPLRMGMRIGGDSFFDLTESQKQELSFLQKENELAAEWFQRKHAEQDPQFLAALQAMELAKPQDPNNISEEERKFFIQSVSLPMNLWFDDMQVQIENTLTPDQMNQVRVFEMLVLPEMGFPSPAMFEPLGLSEEQRLEMQQIKKEFEVEFDQLLDEIGLMRDEGFREAAKILRRENPGRVDQAARSKALERARSSENMKQKARKIKEKGSQFVTRFKEQLMNVLTDEQLDKMQKLYDERPEFVKTLLEAMRNERIKREKSEDYIPGPDSWRPGDEIPEEFKRKRFERKFPTRQEH